MEINKLPDRRHTLVLSLDDRERLILHHFVKNSWLNLGKRVLDKWFKNFYGTPEGDTKVLVTLGSMLQQLERKLNETS